MSLIEQAAKRLEQLRQAGVQLPDEDAGTQNSLVSTGTAGTTKPEAIAKVSQPTVPKHQSEIETVLRPSVASGNHVELNMDAIAASGLLVPNATRSLLANEFRVIKRPLIANAIGRGAAPVANGKLIMITSASRARARVLPLLTSRSALPWNWTTPSCWWTRTLPVRPS